MSEAGVAYVNLSDVESATVVAVLGVLGVAEEAGSKPEVLSSVLVAIASDIVRKAVPPAYFPTALEKLIAALRQHAARGVSLMQAEGEP